MSQLISVQMGGTNSGISLRCNYFTQITFARVDNSFCACLVEQHILSRRVFTSVCAQHEQVLLRNTTHDLVEQAGWTGWFCLCLMDREQTERTKVYRDLTHISRPSTLFFFWMIIRIWETVRIIIHTFMLLEQGREMNGTNIFKKVSTWMNGYISGIIEFSTDWPEFLFPFFFNCTKQLRHYLSTGFLQQV